MAPLRAPTTLTPELDQDHRLAGAASAEDATSAFLRSTAHPLAPEYREVRAFFDTLTHHGGAFSLSPTPGTASWWRPPR